MNRKATSSAIHVAAFLSFSSIILPQNVLSFVGQPVSLTSREIRPSGMISTSKQQLPRKYAKHTVLNSLSVPNVDANTEADDRDAINKFDNTHSLIRNGASDNETGKAVPTKLSEAIRVFFTHDYGPLYVVLTLILLSKWRLNLASIGVFPLNSMDMIVFGGAIVFWWFQEHFLHQRVLHSKFDWAGKRIHEGHHAQPYYHVSIEPAGLIMGWLATAFVILTLLLPSLSLSISATIGYALAGLFYEWSHYLVHTKVPLHKSKFWTRIKSNHVRHHVVNHNYWFGFSLPWIDDLFRTNPSVKDVKRVTIGDS